MTYNIPGPHLQWSLDAVLQVSVEALTWSVQAGWQTEQDNTKTEQDWLAGKDGRTTGQQDSRIGPWMKGWYSDKSHLTALLGVRDRLL